MRGKDDKGSACERVEFWVDTLNGGQIGGERAEKVLPQPKKGESLETKEGAEFMSKKNGKSKWSWIPREGNTELKSGKRPSDRHRGMTGV